MSIYHLIWNQSRFESLNKFFNTYFGSRGFLRFCKHGICTNQHICEYLPQIYVSYLVHMLNNLNISHMYVCILLIHIQCLSPHQHVTMIQEPIRILQQQLILMFVHKNKSISKNERDLYNFVWNFCVFFLQTFVFTNSTQRLCETYNV